MDYFEVQRRREYFDEKERPEIQGKVSVRVELFLSRCYMFGDLKKPLNTITDAEFLSIAGLGPKTLANIRQVIPAPANKQ